MATVRFDAVQLHDLYRRAIMKRIKDGRLSNKEGNQLIEFYEDQAESYTYLRRTGSNGIRREKQLLSIFLVGEIMVAQKKSKASKFLTVPTRPVPIDRDRSVAGLLEKMEGAGFGAKQLAEAHRIWLDMLDDNSTIYPLRFGKPDHVRNAAPSRLRH